MVDRAARDEMIRLIEDFLNDRLTAFEFDDKLAALDSDDHLVKETIYYAWFTYDDLTDHLVNLDKATWDWFQRAMLLLRSDVEAIPFDKRNWIWGKTQAVAVFLVTALTAGYFITQLTPWFLLLVFAASFPFMPKYCITRPRRDVCDPFRDYAQIRKLRLACPDSRKQRYRWELAGRLGALPGPSLRMFTFAMTYVLFALLSPLFLILNCLPHFNREGYYLSGGQLESAVPSP